MILSWFEAAVHKAGTVTAKQNSNLEFNYDTAIAKIGIQPNFGLRSAWDPKT
jgi:hypothetical protein